MTNTYNVLSIDYMHILSYLKYIYIQNVIVKCNLCFLGNKYHILNALPTNCITSIHIPNITYYIGTNYITIRYAPS